MQHVPRSVDALFGPSRLIESVSVSAAVPTHDLANAIYTTDTTIPGMASPQSVF